jgi:hypothetical protein
MNIQLLLALRESISKEPGLYTKKFYDKKHSRVCAVGSLVDLEHRNDSETFAYALEAIYRKYKFDNIVSVFVLNDYFEGTPEERREYMLKWIESELASRAKPINVPSLELACS